MILTEEIIAKLKTGRHGFVFFRFPEESQCHVMIQLDTETYDLPAGWRHDMGYMIQGFGTDYESLCIKADHYSVFDMSALKKDHAFKKEFFVNR